MKLLVDAHIFDSPVVEGVTTYLKGLYSTFINLPSNIEVYFVAHDVEKLQGIFGERNNVRYIAYKNTNKYTRLAVELPSIIKKQKIDIAHFQYISPLRKTCKEIVTTHDVLFKDFPQYFPWSYKFTKDFLFKRSAKRADLLVTVSEYSRNALSAHYGINKDKIYITPNAVSEDFFTPSSVSQESFKKKYGFDKYILFVSRIEPRKNHITLVKAYENLALWEKGAKLVFVGKETVNTDEFHAYCQTLSQEAKSNIIHIPQLTYSELIAAYDECSLFVYPSIAEGFGIPPIEAAARGVPCLCSNSTAMSDFNFFKEGSFNPNDVNELEQKIGHFFDGKYTPDTRKIQSIVNEKYCWETIAKNFLQKINVTFGNHNDKVE